MRAVATFALLTIAGCGGAIDGGIDAGLDGSIDAREPVDAWHAPDVGTDADRDAAHIDAAMLADAYASDVVALPDTYAPETGLTHDGGPSPSCPPGGDCTLASGGAGACCDGACRDLANDDTHCGRCGLRCRPGMSCVEGACAYRSCAAALDIGQLGDTFVARCVLADGTPGGLCCGGACHPPADFDHDDAHCGGCAFECPSGETCTGGECVHGALACGASVPGACPSGTSCWQGTACLPSGCAGEPDGTICSFTVTRFGACCGGTCVDPTRDDQNCGACGRVCGTGTTCAYYGDCYPLPPCSDPGMSNAWCVLPTGGMGRCCGPDCVDPFTDERNCDACGITCTSGATCTSGECVTTLGDGGLTVVRCASDGDCPSGTVCDPDTQLCARSCVGQPDGSACYVHGSLSNGSMCCGGACVDPTQSPNCGACGVSCGSGRCVNVSGWPARSFITCVPDRDAITDCSGSSGCPSGDACVGGVCLPPTCHVINSLCIDAHGAPGTCNYDIVGGATVLTCIAR